MQGSNTRDLILILVFRTMIRSEVSSVDTGSGPESFCLNDHGRDPKLPLANCVSLRLTVCASSYVSAPVIKSSV